MVKKSTSKAMFVAILNNDKVAFRIAKTHVKLLELYVRDLVREYGQIVPPLTLKDYVVEMVSEIKNKDIEVIENVELCDITVLV